MTQTIRLAGDIIAFAAFAGAALVGAFTPPAADGRGRPVTKWLLVLGFALYAAITALDSAVDLGFKGVSGIVADYAEALFPVVVLGIMFAKYSAQQYARLERAGLALQNSHDLMLGIVDGAPAGIAFLDDSGRVVFANDAAREMLQLDEGDAGGVGPTWTVRGVAGARPGDLSPLLDPEPFTARTYTFDQPDADPVSMRVSGEPLSDAAGRLGGMVITFERV